MSPVSAAIRPSIEPLPNFSGSLLAALAAAYDIHAPESSPTPGMSADAARRSRPSAGRSASTARTSRKRGSTESFSSMIFALDRARRSVVSTSAKPNAPTSAGISEMPPASSVPAEGEAVVGIHAFLADLRDEEAERAHQPALERVVADDGARHRHAEEREPEELVGAERERDLGEHRRERRPGRARRTACR